MKYFILLLSIFTCCSLYSQGGTLQGKVIDKLLGEPFPFASVTLTVKGNPIEVHTDFEGFYEFKNIPPGIHLITAKFVSYIDFQEEVTITNSLTFLDIIMKDARTICGGGYDYYIDHKPPLHKNADMTTGYTYSRRDMKRW